MTTISDPTKPLSSANTEKIKSLDEMDLGKYPSFACVPLLNPFPTIPPVPTAISDCRKFQLTPIPFGSIASGQIKDIILSL
jgi:hypothetical protein